MISNRITRATWIEHISKQEKTKLTQVAYCQEHELSISAFRYWKKRQTKMDYVTTQKIIEVPLLLAEANSGMLKLGFPNGCFLEVPPGWGTLAILEVAKAVYHL